MTSHFKRGCYAGDVYWLDSCAGHEEQIEDCGARGCTEGVCNLVRWTAFDTEFAGLAMTNADFVLTSTGQIILGALAQTQANLRFKRWDGAKWGDFSATGAAYVTSGTVSSSIDLALGPQDKIGAVFTISTPNYIEWNGSSWSGLDGSESTGFGDSGSADSLAFGSNGQPNVTYGIPGYFERDIYYRRHENAAWGGLGGSDSGFGLSGSGIAQPSRVVIGDDNNPVVGWYGTVGTDASFNVKKWGSGTWNALASITVTSGVYRFPLAARGNRIALVWKDGDAIKGRVWDNGVATDSVVATRSAGNTRLGDAAVAIDDTGRPLVTWEEDAGAANTYAIFVKRLEGTNWTELGQNTVGQGATSGRGLAAGYSGSAQAAYPWIEVTGNRVCVGWIPQIGSGSFALQCAGL